MPTSPPCVTIAEPLGFLPELNVLIQRAAPGETTLGDRIECMLLRDPGEHGDQENVRDLLGKTARGLSALHGCGLHGPPSDGTRKWPRSGR